MKTEKAKTRKSRDKKPRQEAKKKKKPKQEKALCGGILCISLSFCELKSKDLLYLPNFPLMIRARSEKGRGKQCEKLRLCSMQTSRQSPALNPQVPTVLAGGKGWFYFV